MEGDSKIQLEKHNALLNELFGKKLEVRSEFHTTQNRPNSSA
jgi:hypothetical protein